LIQRYEIEYSIKLKNTIDDFIKKNIKSQQYYNLKEKRLIKFIHYVILINIIIDIEDRRGKKYYLVTLFQ